MRLPENPKISAARWLAARTKRERRMLAGVLLCALLVAAFAEFSRLSELNALSADCSARLTRANAALDMESVIAARLKKHSAAVDRAAAFDAEKLQIAVENAARGSGADYSLSRVSEGVFGGFKISKIELSTTAQPLERLAALEAALRELEPQARILDWVVVGDRNGNASVRYTIAAVKF